MSRLPRIRRFIPRETTNSNQQRNPLFRRKGTRPRSLRPRRFGIVGDAPHPYGAALRAFYDAARLGLPRCGPASTSVYWRSPSYGSPMASQRAAVTVSLRFQLRSRTSPDIHVRSLATVLLAHVPAFAESGSPSELLWGSPYRFWYE
jgi:hypothetical protein